MQGMLAVARSRYHCNEVTWSGRKEEKRERWQQRDKSHNNKAAKTARHGTPPEITLPRSDVVSTKLGQGGTVNQWDLSKSALESTTMR